MEEDEAQCGLALRQAQIRKEEVLLLGLAVGRRVENSRSRGSSGLTAPGYFLFQTFVKQPPENNPKFQCTLRSVGSVLQVLPCSCELITPFWSLVCCNLTQDISELSPCQMVYIVQIGRFKQHQESKQKCINKKVNLGMQPCAIHSKERTLPPADKNTELYSFPRLPFQGGKPTMVIRFQINYYTKDMKYNLYLKENKS